VAEEDSVPDEAEGLVDRFSRLGTDTLSSCFHSHRLAHTLAFLSAGRQVWAGSYSTTLNDTTP
jgi:hypothetical protein